MAQLLLAEKRATVFFDGWAARPGLVACLMLVVAAVARGRYHRPAAGRLLDPILTSGDGCLRLESFSSCCGVYARADLLPGSIHEGRSGNGTTNVDLNQDVRDVLARLDDRDELRLSVGTAGLRVTTREHDAFEKKVTLPKRWVQGLGEAALAQVGMQPYAVITAPAARRLLQALPPPSPSRYAIAPEGRELRFRSAVRPGAPRVAGPHRLRELRPLARYAEGLTVWCRPDGGGATAWQLDLPGARMWLVLSPEVARGFSGEGQALEPLTDPVAVAEADAVRHDLDWSAGLDETVLAAGAGVPAERVRTLLAVLGSQGLVGRDAAAAAWFRRDLPFATDRIEKLQPRVRRSAHLAARDLAAAPVDGGYEVFVRSGEIEHRVVLAGGRATCTCLWFSRYEGSRGPCRHVLAARGHLVREGLQ